MGSWRNIILLALTGALALMVAAYFQRPEPSFAGKPVTVWFHELHSPDYNARFEAAHAVKAMGGLATPHLIKMLRKDDALLREHAAWLGRKLGRDFAMPDPVESRVRAANLLPELGPAAAPALRPLVQTLADDETRVADEARRALIRLKDISLPSLFEGAKDKHSAIRLHSLRALAEIEPGHARALNMFIAAGQDAEQVVRAEAARILGEVGYHPGMQAEALAAQLRDPSPPVRKAAAKALGQIAPDTTTLPALARALEDADPGARVQAANAHWRISGQPERARETLIAALDERSVAWEAAYILAEMQADAAPAVPKLIELLRNERVPRPFREPPSAAFALGRIGGPSVLPLVETLADQKAWIRCSAALALSFVGQPAAPAIPTLTDRLRDESQDVRSASLLALVKIGSRERSLIPPLEEMLYAEDIFLRAVAVKALREIAPEQDWEAQPE